MGLDTLDELMNLVPGYQSYRTSASSLAYLFSSSRGRRIAPTDAEVLVMVEGQRLDDPGSNGIGNVIPKYPLKLIERVEIIRDPGAIASNYYFLIPSSDYVRLIILPQDPVKGFEFELSHILNRHWLFRTTYTYFSDTPDLSFREAEHLVSLMVNFQQQNWNANLIATRSSKREMTTGADINNRFTLDYWQVFGKVQYSLNSEWQVLCRARICLMKIIQLLLKAQT